MRNTYKAVRSLVSLEDMLRILKERPCQQMFPVIEDGTNGYYGFVTREDVLQYQKNFPDSKNKTVIDVLFWALTEAHLPRTLHAHIWYSPGLTLKILGKHKLEFLPVLDNNEKYIGTIDVEEIADMISQD